MRLRFLVLSLLFITSSRLSAQASKKYNSLFWEITGNGLQKPSYLYGTMHVSNKVAFHLSDSFFVAMKGVEQVALETNPENWMDELYGKPKNQLDIDYSIPQSNSSFYKNCFYLNLPSNRDLKGVLKYYPNIINNLLYRKKEGQDNFEENTYLDLFILQAGKKYGKKVVNLEDYNASQKLVDIAAESINENEEDQISYTKKSKILKGTTYLDVIEDAYRRGDLDYMDSISHVFYPSKNYNKYMLDIRNEIMVRGMDSIMKSHSLFTGVGAAHLPGDKGVINLLIKKGYKVRPIFMKSDLEGRQKEDVEKIHFPVSFTTYTDPDSLFTVDVPGKMYEIAKAKSYKYYMYPDMVNGCFYMVMTVQNYAALLGVKPSDYMKKVDSLLFENIPGKILKKTPFEANNGWQGYNIENVTKRGDAQFYKIMFSPTQLIIVKVNGNGDYAKGSEAQRFINSIKLKDIKSKQFVTHQFKACGASVYMPSYIQQQSSKDYNYKTFTHFTASGLDENNKQYVFIQSVYHDFKYLEEDTFELNVLSEAFCKEQGLKLKTKKLLSKTRYPSLQFTATYNTNEVSGRLVVSQPFYYLLITNAKDKQAEVFYNSLELKNPQYTQPFSTFIDSTLYFKVNTLTMVDLDKKNLVPYEDKKPTTKAKKEKEIKPYYFNRTHYFSAPSSGECVMVEAIRFSKYGNVMSPDTFWTRRALRYANKGDLYLKTQQVLMKPHTQEAYYTYTDTNTHQLIQMKLVLKGEVLYVLRSNADSTRSCGTFITEFFKTFEPLDTVIGTSIYVSKANQFFHDLYSKDKPTQLGARQAIENRDVEFFVGDDSIILRNIKQPEFRGLSLKAKTNLITELSKSKDLRMTDDLRSLYESYTDSTDIQLAILETLSDMKTEASARVVLDLLINDTPPLNGKGDAQAILAPYFDSLQLTRMLFPKLLDLTRYAEYKHAVHNLLAYAVYKGVISKETYSSYKPFLLKEGKDELKRQFGAEKEGNDYKDTKNNMEFIDTQKDPAEKDIFSGYDGQAYFGNENLYALAILLEPFYQEPATKMVMDKITRIQDARTKSTIISYLLSRQVSFADTILKTLAANTGSRPYWYKRLKKYGLERYFDKTYLSQDDFAYALTVGDKLLDTEDTLRLIEKRFVWYKNHKGTAYFYKLKEKNETNEVMYVTGVFPLDGKQLVFKDMLDIPKKTIEKGDEEKELIDDMVQTIRFKNRKRTQRSGSSYNSFFE